MSRKNDTWEILSNDNKFKIILGVKSSTVLSISVSFLDKNPGNSTKALKFLFLGEGDFFGGGEHFTGTRLNGHVLSNQPRDHAWIPHDPGNHSFLVRDEPTYLPIPFVFAVQGNGLYVDEANTTLIDLQISDNRQFAVSVKGSFADLFLIAEKSPKKILSAFTSIAGRTPIPPYWAFGVWVNLPKGVDSVIYRARLIRQLEIPVTAIWIFDIDDPSSNTGWTYWTNGYFGNPRDITDTLHSLHFKVLTYLRSFVNKDLSYYDLPNPVYAYCDKNQLILSADKLNRNIFSDFHSNDQINFYNPASDVWWKKILERNLLQENFDGWMEDFGDVNYVYNKITKKYFPMDFHLDTSYAKLSNEEIANLYPLVYHKLSHELTSSIKPEAVEFSRSGSAGSAAYSAIIWGGDQDGNWDKDFGYPSAISAGISTGLSGYSIWAPDILCLSPSRELWKRWVEFGALSPVMRDHLWDYQPENIKMWTDSLTLQFFKKYAKIHEAIQPYLYETAKNSVAEGIPVLRSLMLEYPKDTTTFKLEYEYLLGEELLVSPVVEQRKIVNTVYLPEGKWRYYWNKKIYGGKQWVTINAPEDEIPFFIKEGSHLLQ